MAMSYMAHRCGSWQVGDDPAGGAVGFRVFFPNVAPTEHARPPEPADLDPHVVGIVVVGDFQPLLAQPAWEPAQGLAMAAVASVDPPGTFWSVVTPAALPAGFYEYQFVVTFDDGTVRWVADPCARYSGLGPQRSGIVVGGSRPTDNVVRPVAGGRRPPAELVVYELMIDDFTAEDRGGRAPLAAVEDRLDEIAAMGFTAIEFMPWTAWADQRFDWGYEPWAYFAVESRYANAPGQPAEKLSLLKHLISACHDRSLHVIMDGVYNHAGRQFPYPLLYRDPLACPFTDEVFVGAFPPLLDLSFQHSCTRDFVDDVVRYWIKEFGIDGIRFDNTKNYYEPGADAPGLSHLLTTAADLGGANFALSIEHIDVSAAAVTTATAATGYWDDALYGETFAALWDGRVRPELLGALNNRRFLGGDPAKAPILYLSNHDHSAIAARAGQRDAVGAVGAWWRIQPYLIALFTSTGVPLVPNGQEYGEDYLLPEIDFGTGRRVVSRPLRWKQRDDEIGRVLVALHTRLAHLRAEHPALRSPDMYPAAWETSQTRFAPTGVGLDTERQVAAYHRWADLPVAPGAARTVENVVVVLNFGDQAQTVDIGFPVDGTWTDLVSNYAGGAARTISVSGGRAEVAVDSHFGAVFWRLNVVGG